MTAPVDPRRAAEFEATLRSRVPGYLPGWTPTPGGAGGALLAIAARYDAIIAERLDLAPVKNQLGFLDMLGVSLLPAQAARAPIAFTMRPGLGDSRAPAGTQVGATVPGVDGPLVFETERDTALVAARLVQVATVWPGQDAWADHTAAIQGRQEFVLFDGLQPMAHELYLGHRVLLALDGRCEVRVQLELAEPVTNPLDAVWEYWDGDGWRGFADFAPAATAGETDSIDGTSGFTRTGTVVLRAEAATTQPHTVNWVRSRWIRVRVLTPLTPDLATGLPSIDRVQLSSVVSHPKGALRIEFRTTAPSYGSLLVQNYAQYLAQCPDPADAWIALSRPAAGDRPAQEYRRTLLGSATSFGPFTAADAGTWTLAVSIPGFTPAAREVQLDTGNQTASIAVLDQSYPNLPDAALADSLPLETTKPFLPFGSNPQPGSTFHLASEEAFAKPGAIVTLSFVPCTGLGLGSTTSAMTTKPLTPLLDAQYHDGEGWRELDCDPLPALFTHGGVLQFAVPEDLRAVRVAGDERRWIRIRILSGSFGEERTLTLSKTAKVTSTAVTPPMLASLAVSYYFRSPATWPQACQSCNDFTWLDHTAAMPARGASFRPFTPSADTTPALYLGFDTPLPADVLGLYADIEETPGAQAGPALVWEAADGTDWVEARVEDETGSLTLPGSIRVGYPGVTPLPAGRAIQTAPDRAEFLEPEVAGLFHAGDEVWIGDDTEVVLAHVADSQAGALTLDPPTAKSYPRATVTKAGPPRFGSPAAAWLRARLRSDGTPAASRVLGLHANTIWAAAVQTRTAEVLGTSDGNPRQTFSVRYPPVLAGQVLEVLELSGARAATDLAMLTQDVLAHGGSTDDLRVETDRRTGAVAKVWVRWQERRNLAFSGPGDRHYTLERSRGVVGFGDDLRGRIPPASVDGIVLRSYRSGGGRLGNVALGAIDQLLSGVPAQSVTNVRAAEGGADTETLPAVRRRGPASVAARSQALTAADYETLAKDASPAVALAWAIPATDAEGLPRPGHVRVVVIPDSAEPLPYPSFGLRHLVEDHLRDRSPASMVGRVHVTGPDYLPVGIQVEVVPAGPDAAGPAAAAATGALRAFLHPLTGGPDGTGWARGRPVYASDLARVLAAVPGLDGIRSLTLLTDGAPVGERVEVPVGRIVVAGQVTVRLAGGE